MKHRYASIKRSIASFLAVLLLAQSVSAIYPYASAVRTSDAGAVQPESTNTSFVSFPSRFQDSLPEGAEEQYYIFELEHISDVSIGVEGDWDLDAFGAELLDSGFESLAISRRTGGSGQRIVRRELQPGTYLLRVFPQQGADPAGAFNVSIQKLSISDADKDKLDLSELHIAAALQSDSSPFFMNGTDPWYTAEQFKTQEGYFGFRWRKATSSDADKGVNSGGIYPMAQTYYASWLGPVEESALPMSSVRNPVSGETYREYYTYLQEGGILYRTDPDRQPLMHVKDGVALPVRVTNSETHEEDPAWEAHIKNALMTYGAVTTGIYWSFYECVDPAAAYTAVPADTDVPGVNHEVVIVGWDDDYPKENFRYKRSWMEDHLGDFYSASPSDAPREENDAASPSAAPRRMSSKASPSEVRRPATGSSAPSARSQDYTDEEIEQAIDELMPDRDGAWIIRNSWGGDTADGGYYYVSYSDLTLGGADNSWAFTAIEASDSYNKLYEVATAEYTYAMRWITDADMVMMSTVFTADTEGTDVLKAVTFDLLNNDIDYEIAVNTGSDVGQGWQEDNVRARGSKQYAGYYTVRLDSPILLEAGEEFEIILKISSRDGDALVIPMIANDNYTANIPSVEGVCRLYDPQEGDKWIDTGLSTLPGEAPEGFYGGYGYFTTRALCYDADIPEGEIGRSTVLELDPDVYFGLVTDEAGAAARDSELQADMADAHDLTDDPGSIDPAGSEPYIQNGHVFMDRRRTSETFSGTPEEIAVTLPESFDLRAEGMLTKVRDQRQTNTCWTFGATAAVESSYLLNGSNLYDINYSSGISMDSELSAGSGGSLIYSFDEGDPETLDDAVFSARLLSWDGGPIEDEGGELIWELSGDLGSLELSEELGSDGSIRTSSGEELLLFTPRSEGVVRLSVSLSSDPTKSASCSIVLMEENDIDSLSVAPEELSLRRGTSRKLEVHMEGPDADTAVPVFSSDDPTVAVADEDGTILGLRAGTTIIRVRVGGHEAVCHVTVWSPTSTGSSMSSGGTGRSAVYAYSGSTPLVYGSWTQAEDGSWRFNGGQGDYKDAWGYIYNPYAPEGQSAGWFRFDAEGRMLTGWFTDADGSRYYLNPVSDGRLGMMLTGWQWIADESGMEYCYYFHTQSGGPMGSMAQDMITPDGYTVDSLGRWCINGVPQSRQKADKQKL